MTTPKPLRFGVIGAGAIGSLHARNIATRVAGASLSAVMDINLEAAEKSLYGNAYATTDLDKMLGDPDIDAVLIASLTSLHSEHIQKSVAAGKAIFCEKPVAIDLEETRRVMKQVDDAGLPFQIGFQRRFDPGYAAIAKAISSGEMGKLEMFRSQSSDPKPAPEHYIATSGGIYIDSVIHDIDVARFVAGEVKRVTALGANPVDPVYEKHGDIAVSILTLEFESGAIGVIQNHRRTPHGYDLRLEVHCEKGKLVTEDERQTKLWRYDQGGIHGDYFYYFMQRFEDAYRKEVQAFVDAVHAKEPIAPGTRDAIESLRVAVAATKSLKEHRPVAIAEV
ncbi:MAG: inositol 2-dehydrogenase [Anaerolineaceae bacterium]|nr:inositol 2-dehydrogenase [Anaerolineaceae bacterium]